MSAPIRVGLAILPERDPAVDGRWRRAEEYGFAHAWTFDHLAWRTLADTPWFALVPTLAAAALSTSRIPIGVFVASPNFRHPVPFAKDLMTLDVMSQGRLIVGIGAGGGGLDAEMLGQPELTPRQRADRFEEFVSLLDVTLRQPVSSWRGEWFAAVGARSIPGPTQRPRPPFVVAGNGPRGMRLALRHGQGWATMGTAGFGAEPELWWQGVAQAAERFREIAAEADRDPAELRWYLDANAGAGPMSSLAKVIDDAGRAAELGFTDLVVAWPRSTEPFQAPEQVLEALAGELDADGRLHP